jgi:hypothetical protein
MIVCAAIRLKDGTLVVGPRHGDWIMQAQLERIHSNMRDQENGFINQDGDFLTRQEAWIEASMCKQIKKMLPINSLWTNLLFSQNLY